MNPDDVKKIVQDELAKGQFNVPKVPYHTHNGTDSPQLNTTSGVAGVASVTVSGSGISAAPNTGNVVLQNTGVTSLIAGSNVTISASTGAITISAGLPGVPIARDTSSKAGLLAGSTTFTISHTISGTNTLLICAIDGHTVTTDLITSVTYNGIAMQRFSSNINLGATAESFWTYYLLSPSTGTHNIVITCSSDPGLGGGGLFVANASYTGVFQTGFPDASLDNSNGSTTSQSFGSGTGINPFEWGVICFGGQTPAFTLQTASGNGSVTSIFSNATQAVIADTNGSINPPIILSTGINGGGGAIFVKVFFVGHA